MRRKLAAGNWKMNGTAADLEEVKALIDVCPAPNIDVLLCPPATLIARMSELTATTAIATGGQDCHPAPKGAHTGDISAAMLKDAGATYVILGHSERRADHGETNSQICEKSQAAMSEGLVAVICIGETLDERERGATLDVVDAQLAGSVPESSNALNTVIAYEPIWAIGTGKIPSLEQIAEVHAHIRARLVARFGEEGQGMRVLYGGSVKPSNAAEIFAVSDVDGALVGGASLKATDFGPIISALEAS